MLICTLGLYGSTCFIIVLDCGLDCWIGLLDWTDGLHYWSEVALVNVSSIFASYHLNFLYSNMRQEF